MKEIVIGREDEGKRLTKYLLKAFPRLNAGLVQKYIRLKRVKVNAGRANFDLRLKAGDVLNLYIEDELLAAQEKKDALLSGFRHHLEIVYEDEDVLIVDKMPGLIVHPDAQEKVNTLVTHARAYLYQKGAYDSMKPSVFAPAPVNRIDRFTGGLVMIAKTRVALDELGKRIRDHEVVKRYLCICKGAPHPAKGRLEGWIMPQGARVRVLNRPEPGAKAALTLYETCAVRDGIALVLCELVTGRTHQIRAQFASAGHPLLGDAQYGDPRFNQRHDRSIQALHAFSLSFDFQSEGPLDSLRGRRFFARRAPFVAAYFPGWTAEGGM